MMGLEDQASDADLLRDMIAGDEQAFVAIYRRLQGPLYRFALQMTGRASLAEEIVQEAFMTLIRQAKSFDASRGTLQAYLYGICRNHTLRCVAQESPYVGMPDAGWEGGNGFLELLDPSDPSASFAAAEKIERVRRAVLTLPPSYREVVVLCDLHEMAYEQAAGVLGCPIGTVRSRLHRARDLLLAKLRHGASGGMSLTAAERAESSESPQ
ncbi:MAG TPA: sigma-70 family RNA polymerase sigma factor [Terriglobia bacterium]|nr:sigma-70 family RNA polymerase sigma factor [Terriglobia bacterium]